MKALIVFPNNRQLDLIVRKENNRFKLFGEQSGIDRKSFDTIEELNDYYTELLAKYNRKFKLDLGQKEEKTEVWKPNAYTICDKHEYGLGIKIGCLECKIVKIVPNVSFVENRIHICEHNKLAHICNK